MTIEITSNDINITDDGIIDDARVISLTPVKLPAPIGEQYVANTSGAFAGLEWDAANNTYKVVTQAQYTTQLELH